MAEEKEEPEDEEKEVHPPDDDQLISAAKAAFDQFVGTNHELPPGFMKRFKELGLPPGLLAALEASASGASLSLAPIDPRDPRMQAEEDLSPWFDTKMAETVPSEYDLEVARRIARLRYLQEVHTRFVYKNLKHLVDDLRLSKATDEMILHLLEPVTAMAAQGIATGEFAAQELEALRQVVAAEHGEAGSDRLTQLLASNMERESAVSWELEDEHYALLRMLLENWNVGVIKLGMQTDEFLEVLPPPEEHDG